MPLRSDSPWQSRSVLGAFDASEEFWSENPDPASGPPPASRGSSGARLIDSISASDMARLRILLVREGLKADGLDTALLADAYSAVSYLQDHALGVDYQAMPERVLRERARIAGKSLHSEWASFEELARFRAAMSPDTRHTLDLELFHRGMEEAGDADAARRRLSAWLRGDIRPLVAQERQQRTRYPTISRLIGSDRNQAWVARTGEIIRRSSTTFVCQGIGHLLGPLSIQAYLQRANYTVERAA